MEHFWRTLGVLGLIGAVFVAGTWALNLISAPSTFRVYSGVSILVVLAAAMIGATLHYKVPARVYEWIINDSPDEEGEEGEKAE